MPPHVCRMAGKTSSPYGSRVPKRQYFCTAIETRRRWVPGQPVVLQVALGDIKVPLRGKLLKVGGETVRMRIGDAWDVDIYKAMILAVEEDSMVLLPA